MADFMTEIDKKFKKNGLNTTREGDNITIQGSKNPTPQDVPEPSGAEASKGYKPEELGSGIRVDGKPMKPEKKMAGGGSASSRADGCAERGKTRGTIVMCGGGMYKK
jgi:hypothetical protein